MLDDDQPPAWKTHGGKLKPLRLKIVDSLGIIDTPRYNRIDPMLLNPYTLLIFQPNRVHLVRGTNLDKIAERLWDEAVTVIQAYKNRPANEPAIHSITLHWLYDKTPEEFLKEIMAEEEPKKPVLEPVS